ncbi:MAG: IPT/TIG domain-containing protein, partial [Terriglobales bacterium]
TGAGAREMCSTNSVIGGVDQISAEGHLAHAVLVINGNCARTAADLPLLRYRLVRQMGRILGLDYSQLNENVVTGSPPPTGEDYAGYPVMHPLGVLCNELSGCMANAHVPRMDDRAALARLYPSGYFAATTARVHGVIRFPRWKNDAGQGMQGMNVVARLVDPVNGRVSRQYAASCVSGFLFRGNAGNPMTGYVNARGERWDADGSSDPALEGLYDLAGLEIPDGYNSATFEVNVESIRSLYNGSTAVGPYVAGQVVMPGMASAVRVTIARGAEVAQDFVVSGTAREPWDRWEPSSFTQPRPVPLAGSWAASVTGYGDRDYYSFHAEAGRTFTFDVTATDENGITTVNKVLPVLGARSAGATEDSPGVTETYFNTAATATTRLQAQVSSVGDYKIGVADYRGDGRPDFLYKARLLYANKLTPRRIGVQGGSVVTIEGLGFAANAKVSITGAPVAAALASPTQVVFTVPPLNDGTYSVVVSDPATGATSEMTDALIVGSAGAKLALLIGANPQVPVGTVAPNPMKVQVVDGTTGAPVSGATVLFSAPSSVSVVGCSQMPCSLLTDQNGVASVQMKVNSAGASVVTATLPTGGTAYATVNGIAADLEITLAQPNVYIVSGATLSVPVTAMVVVNGKPAAGKNLDFLKNYGTATVAPASALTGVDGTAASAVNVTAIASDVNISACVAPADAPCRTLLIHPVASGDLQLQKVSGDAQVISVGQSFSPVVLRTTDKLGNPVAGVKTTFEVLIYRATAGDAQQSTDEVSTTRHADPVVISSAIVTATTDAAGLAVLPLVSVPSQPVVVKIRASAANWKLAMELESTASKMVSGGQTSASGSRSRTEAGTKLKKSAARRF